MYIYIYIPTNQEIGLSIIAIIIGFDFEEGWYSFYSRDCSEKVTKMVMIVMVNRLTVMGHVLIFRVRVVILVQDETGSASFVLFDRHVKDVIHRNNHWLMEKISNIALYYTILLICTHDELTIYCYCILF
uniref:Replication factor A C-terminal domain-containing protein n=1 Tax=Lactuca sativa TaxID=4236 RepID=A0A9R1W494_LACSA|nr:hypothetical protein LSAT_V11C300153060 [Lactuca sativa]